MKANMASTLVTLALVSGTLLTGCQQELMPTPNLYLGSKEDPFKAVPPALQSNRAEVIYATDRTPIQTKAGQLKYGYERSRSLAFGNCTVEIGRDLSWDELVRESKTERRSRGLPLNVGEIQELGRFPDVPDLMSFDRDEYKESPKLVADREATERQLIDLLSQRLAQTSHQEAYVYIHGFSNTFADAAFVMAGLWHFMGRTGVPIIYTWPAGSPEGALGGYTHDSESGQFTGYHLKHFLRTIASCPDLKKIHLIAHSRGTDVLMTALRELNIEYRAAGRQTRSELKLGNLVLAAADLDAEVTSQRIIAEMLPFVPERMTMYVSSTDRAIGAADILFGSKARLGRLRWVDLNTEQRQALERVSRLHIIDARVRTSFLGHSYFHESPAVSSDLILLLRDSRAPGADHGRPLIRRSGNFWEVNDQYLR